MTQRPAVLFLAHRIPYPPDKGDKIRSWRLVKHLGRRFDVHLVAFVDDMADMAHRGALEAHCKTVDLFPLSPLRARLRSLLALIAGGPMTFSYFHDARLQRRVEDLRRLPLAAEIAFSSSMAPYIDSPVAGRPRLVDLCDSDAEKFCQYADDAGWPARAVYSREAKTLSLAETDIAGWADAAFAVSPAEAAVFNSRPGARKTVQWFGNGVDADYFSPERDYPAPDRPADVVFTGVMDYRANIDAVTWFAAHVWPLVRAQLPAATFAIVGARPVNAIRALARSSGIHVTGRVDDVRPWLAHARLAVAPMRVARGVQNKVLEAMAMALPVVATEAAMTGIEATTGEEAVLADSAAMFAGEVVRLLNDPDARAAIGAAARGRMLADYTWAAQMKRFDEGLGAAAIIL